MNKKSGIAFSALALSLVLASCGGTKEKLDPTTDVMPKTVDTFNTIYSTDPTTFASWATNEQPNSQHITNFVDGLVENDNYGKLVPALAKSIPGPVEKNGKSTYTFELKDGLCWSKWQNGQLVKAADLTAQDFITGARLALDPTKEGGSSYLFFTFIEGSEEYYKMQMNLNDDPKWKAPTKEELDAAWEKVGIKAIGNNKIEYTLIKPMSYFPTVLTYTCYYPVPTTKYNEITDNYGKIGYGAKDNLWYCGAFALDETLNNNKISYAKNPLYWDAENVSLNKVNHIYAPQDADQSWARQQFNAGAIDSFRVQEIDKKGWDSLVKGKDGKGTQEHPADPFTNSLESTPDTGTFYMGFNYNRSEDMMTVTDLSKKQIRDFETAIQNANFRKAILYATDKGQNNLRYTKSNPNQWTANLYTTSTLAVDPHGKDYVEYVYDEFAAQETAKGNPMTPAEAKALIKNGTPGVMDAAKAKEYLALAKQELEGKVTFPIQFEIQQRQNASFSPYYQAFERALQTNLDPSEEIVDVTTLEITSEQSKRAFFHYDFSVSVDFGWSPDYGDPLSFLGTLIKEGDLTPNMGLKEDKVIADKVIGKYTELVLAADKLTDPVERLKAYAKAEYQLLFEDALIIPLTNPLQGISVTVTKLKPKTAQIAAYGNGRDKLKGTIVYEHKLNQNQFNKVLAEYEAGKAEA